MRKWFGPLLPALAFALFLCGCQATGTQAEKPQTDSKTTDTKEEATVQANLAKLSPDDRKIAEQQKYCAVESESRLGAHGKPIKVVLDGQPVFLCCKNCKEQAEEKKEETLAAAKKLRDRHPSP